MPKIVRIVKIRTLFTIKLFEFKERKWCYFCDFTSFSTRNGLSHFNVRVPFQQCLLYVRGNDSRSNITHCAGDRDMPAHLRWGVDPKEFKNVNRKIQNRFCPVLEPVLRIFTIKLFEFKERKWCYFCDFTLFSPWNGLSHFNVLVPFQQCLQYIFHFL